MIKIRQSYAARLAVRHLFQFTENILDVTGGSLLSINISVNFRNFWDLRVIKWITNRKVKGL